METIKLLLLGSLLTLVGQWLWRGYEKRMNRSEQSELDASREKEIKESLRNAKTGCFHPATGMPSVSLSIPNNTGISFVVRQVMVQFKCGAGVLLSPNAGVEVTEIDGHPLLVHTDNTNTIPPHSAKAFIAPYNERGLKLHGGVSECSVCCEYQTVSGKSKTILHLLDEADRHRMEERFEDCFTTLNQNDKR